MKIKRMPHFQGFLLHLTICNFFQSLVILNCIKPRLISLLFQYFNFIIAPLWIIPMQFSICCPFYLYKLYISFFYQRKQMWLQSEWSLFNVVLCGTLSSNTTYFTSFFKEVTIYRPLSRLSLWKKTKNKLLFWCVPMYVCKKTLAVEKDKRYKSSIGS